MRQSKSTPQADALLLAMIKAVGIVQPPVITAETRRRQRLSSSTPVNAA